MQKSISIIYCYRNREIKRVKNSLDSLNAQLNKNFQVIFVDYGSNLEYRKQIEALCNSYKFCAYIYVDSEGKLWNRSEALNYGLLLCKTDYVFTADVDLVFKVGFTDALHKDLETDIAKFYAVGYLNEEDTKALALNRIESLSFVRSEDFALGMALIERKKLEEVNGYNTFYSIWGLEDNDLKFRLEKMGCEVLFISNVFMLHQYHPLVNENNNDLPQGWVQYLKDYFEYNGKQGNLNNGLSQITYPLLRPAKELARSKNEIKKTIVARRLFVRHELINAILISKSKVVCYDIGFSSQQLNQTSKTVKLINLINRLFSTLKIPIRAQSSFIEQYASRNDIYGEICFVLACLDQYLLDYYFKENEKSIELIIVKK